MNNVALIVPTLNRYDLFVNMIQTIDYPIVPYVINNGKNGNIGVAAAWNNGIRRAMRDGHRYAIISNDDIEFMPGTIMQLVRDIQTYDAITIGTNSILPKRDGDSFYYKKEGMVIGYSYPCFIVDMTTLVNEVGYFDENFYPAYYEDSDMQYRIKLAGHKEYINTDIGVVHHGSATQFATKDRIVSKDKWAELQEYYKSKWGGYAWEEKWTHPYNENDKGIKYWREPDVTFREVGIGIPYE